MNKSNLIPKPLFLERIKQLLPDEKDFQSYLEILKHDPVRSIRCNTLKITPKELKKRLEEKNWKISQPWENYPEVFIIEGKYSRSRSQFNKDDNKISKQQKDSDDINHSSGVGGRGLVGWDDLIPLEPGELGRSLEHLLGYYYVQELASMLPVIALNPQEGELILDLAASPGSKTTQISAKMKNTGTIIANEVSLGRIKILASNLERCGVTNCIITRKDGVAFCERIKKFNPNLKLDKILIDAPCSGEGTLRSTPKTYQMWNPKTIFNLSRLQKSLVASAIEILKDGGTLVYSTCTHAPEENEEVVNFVLEKFPEIKIEQIKLPIKCRQGITIWQDKEYNKEIKKSCRIYPHDANTEGFFITKFKKIN